MASICAACNLYHPFSDLYPDQADTPTYVRGRKRLDWVLVSRSLYPSIDAIGYNRYNLLYHSDHRAIFLDLAKRDSLGLSSPLVPHSRRPIHSNSPYVRDFVWETYKHLQENKALHKFTEFSLDAPLPTTPPGRPMPSTDKYLRPSSTPRRNAHDPSLTHGQKSFTSPASNFATGKQLVVAAATTSMLLQNWLSSVRPPVPCPLSPRTLGSY